VQESGNGASASANLFAARDVTLYLHDVRDVQSRARGISCKLQQEEETEQAAGRQLIVQRETRIWNKKEMKYA
jgi:hypothetical protein